MVWEFLCTDVEGIESVGAVGAVFEQVFFGLGKFFAGLVFADAVAPATDPGVVLFNTFVLWRQTRLHINLSLIVDLKMP